MPSLPEGRWLDVEGIRTRYFEAGQGEPIVFIYGGNFGTADSASSAYTWSKQVLPLSRNFRAIAFDKLGQGRCPLRLAGNYLRICRHPCPRPVRAKDTACFADEKARGTKIVAKLWSAPAFEGCTSRAR